MTNKKKLHSYKRLCFRSMLVLAALVHFNIPVSAQFNYDTWIAEEWVKTRDLDKPLYDTPPEVKPGDVVGWSADGGQADVDDWAASPVALAVFAKKGWHNKLVHFDYNSRIDPARNLDKEAENYKSTVIAATKFEFDTTVFFNNCTELEASIEHAKNVINSCHEGRRFFWCIAGPFEVAWLALNRAEPEKRKFVYLISHSSMNELTGKWKLSDGSPSRGMIECCNPINPPEGYVKGLGARYYYTSKQGTTKFGSKGHLAGWEILDWMKNSSCEAYKYLYTRLEAARDYHVMERQEKNPGMTHQEVMDKWGGVDASDGGMSYTIAMGDWNGNLEKFTELLGDCWRDSTNHPTDTTAYIAPGIQKKESMFNLAPNPSNGMVNIFSYSAFESFDVHFFDLRGHLILKTDIENEKTEIDLSHLQKGAYIVNATKFDINDTKMLLLE